MGSRMLSLIIPIYRNEESLSSLFVVIGEINKEIPGELEVILVVDGCPDRSYEILLEKLPTLQIPTRLLLLSRNFGSFAAIRAGLEAGSGTHFAVMAADLQDPPELVIEMYRTMLNDTVDVVIGVREARGDPLSSQLPARMFWWLYRRFVISEVPPGGVDIFACTKVFREQLLLLRESHSSLISQIFWLGYRRRFISYVRRQREHGKSAWTFRKKVNYLMDSVFAFTDLPIRMLIWGGGLGVLLSGLFGMAVIIGRLAGWVTVPGYAATIVVIVFLGALNLFGLGVVGSYAWRAYENTKARPLNIVLRKHEFNMQ